MNANLFTQRKNSLVFEAATAKATDEQLAEVNSELALGFRQSRTQRNSELILKLKNAIRLTWNFRPSAKHGVNIAAIKHSRAKFNSTAKKSIASSKPT